MLYKYPQCPWMDFAETEKLGGVREIAGNSHNRRIQEYLASVNLAGASDETRWCAAFVNWCVTKAGYKPFPNAWAEAWGNYGTPTTPRFGAIAATAGHVGFFAYMKNGVPYLLGGNQSNMITIAKATKPLNNLRFRWPVSKH